MVAQFTPPAGTLNRYLTDLSDDTEYFYSCDAHLVVEPDMHERFLMSLVDHPDAVCLHGFAYHWQVANGPWSHTLIEWQYTPIPCISLWHLPTLRKIGGFFEGFPYGHIVTTSLTLVHHGFGTRIHNVPAIPEPQPGEDCTVGVHRMLGHHIDPDMDLWKFIKLHYIAGVCFGMIERAFPGTPYTQSFNPTFHMAKTIQPNQLGALMKSVCHGMNVLGCIEGFDLIPRGRIVAKDKEVRYIFEGAP